METVTMVQAEAILSDWFSEHEGHDVDTNPTLGKVELWCEDCRELRSFRIEGFGQAVEEMMKRDGAVTFGR